MKRFFYFALAVLTALGIFAVLPASAYAGPPNPDPISVTQPDGSTFMARTWGDEWSNGMETAEGFTIVLDRTNGYWVYAVRSSQGTLTPAASPTGEPVVGREAPPPSARHARPDAPDLPGRRSPSTISPQTYVRPNTGTQKVLVLLVGFANQGPVGTTAADWNSKFFGSTGSVNSYYAEASYNSLNLAPAAESYGTTNDGVVGWLTLPYNHPNTGATTGDANRQIVRDAIIAANPYVDFSSFDTNHNGFLSTDELHIVTVVAGYEMSYGGSSSCSPRIWGHNWSLDGNVLAPVVDNVTVASWSGGGGYIQFGEWHCVTSQRPGHAATIGVPAHELGHDLGLPDLYDTDSTTNGIGDWDIMAVGAWNSSGGYAGNSPAYPGAWDKWYEGWLTPTRISGSVTGQSLLQSEGNASAFQLLDNPGGVDWLFYSHSGSGEYFLLENRQKVGFDVGLPGCGLLIWHIDEGVTSSNQANANESHRLVDLEQADGLFSLNNSPSNWGDAGDPYPGSTGNHTFDGTSTPNSNLYGGAASGVSVLNIGSCGPTMTADLSVGTIGSFSKTTPASGAVNQPTSLTLTWGSSTNATSYEYCYDTTNDSTCAGSWLSAGTSRSVGLNGLGANTTYYWQVRARSAAGTTEADGGQWWRFTTAGGATNDDFGSPTAISATPFTASLDTRAASTAADDPTFTCLAGKGSASVWFRFTPATNGVLKANTTGSDYDTVLAVWQGARGSLSSIACNDNTVNARTSSLTANLISGNTYYLEIAGHATGGSLKLSVGFTPKAPAGIKLLSPANGGQSTGASQVLDWTDSAGATYYQLEVHKSSATGAIVASAKPSGSTYTTGSLAVALYYWRVRACNPVGCSSWSAAWSFKIIAPKRPNLLSPANSNSPTGPVVSLDWSDSTGASYYQVQVRKDKTSGLIVIDQKPTVSAIAASGLLSGHWYYWHVRACSTVGCSAWTAWWRFKLP